MRLLSHTPLLRVRGSVARNNLPRRITEQITEEDFLAAAELDAVGPDALEAAQVFACRIDITGFDIN